MEVSNILCILAACLVLQVYAAEAVSQDQEIEEITVIGQKLILDLRTRIELAEDHAFNIFNALNDDDLYDVHCEMVARTGTLIRKRMCLPNFYHRATANEASMSLGLISNYTNFPSLSPSAKLVFAQQFPIFKDKVKSLAEENPAMLDALKELFELNQELKKTRSIYHGTEGE